MIDDKISISKDSEEALRNSIRSVIYSEPGQELYKLQKKIAKEIQELSHFMKNKTAIQYFTLNQLIDDCFDMDMQGNVFIGDFDYDTITSPARIKQAKGIDINENKHGCIA